MSPIDSNNRIFSDDFHKFVLQDQPIVISPFAERPEKFTLNKTKKSKQAKEKEDSPWLPKKSKKELADEE